MTKFLKLLPFLLAVPAFGCAGRDPQPYPVDEFRYDGDSLFDDGVMVFFRPDVDPAYRCAGADVRWVGRDAHITFMRSKVGSNPIVDAPARVTREGRRFVFLSTTHLEPGPRIAMYLDDGDATRFLSAWGPASDESKKEDPAPPPR